MVSMLTLSVVLRGFQPCLNYIGSVMVSMLTLSVVLRGFQPCLNYIGSVMVSMLTLSVVLRGFQTLSDPKAIKLVFAASALNM
jgi:hypothetical protein